MIIPYYIVKKFEWCDREKIILDTFITINPEKYSDKKKFDLEIIKLK